MSAGEFTVTRYELSADNGGGIAAVQVQPETLAASIASTANAAPAGAVTIPFRAKVSKGVREYGIGCRTVTLEWLTAPPDGYSGENVTIPVLTPATAAAWVTDAEGTYLGAGVKVVGRSPERVR